MGKTQEIRRAIQEAIFWSSASPVPEVAEKFGITKQAVQLHVKHLVDEGFLDATGERRYRRYALRQTLEKSRRYKLGAKLTEDVVWDDFVQPMLVDLPMEDVGICHYGLTEMVNNAIDHANATQLSVSVALTLGSVELQITDNGIGIFEKIATALKVIDPRQVLIELSKGKFTTDPKRHTGEGIFFTARSFDRFEIVSSNLEFVHVEPEGEWKLESLDRQIKGTRFKMGLITPTTRIHSEVFQAYSSGPEDYRFAKTHVPIDLAKFGDENLVSRSSAKRVLARVHGFDEVILDFKGIRSIGQAFADEIFRVFANEHLDVKLVPINANLQVTGMIRRAEAARREMS